MVLGEISDSKGENEKAIHRFETALLIASPFNWHEALFWIHHSLAELFREELEFVRANTHNKQAKLHAANDAYTELGRAIQSQARVWYLQLKLEDARLEVLHAPETYENLGAASDAKFCRSLLQMVEGAITARSTSFKVSFWKRYHILRLSTATSQHEVYPSVPW